MLELFIDSSKNSSIKISGRSTAVIVLNIERFLFTVASWSNPSTFAPLVLWIERTSQPYANTQVPAPTSKILI
jgi:hypothetical protein